MFYFYTPTYKTKIMKKNLSLIFCLCLSKLFFAQKGLVGEYYNGLNFEQKITSRIDPSLDFYWNFRSPANGVNPHDFSIRWTGQLTAPETGEYIIGATVDDGIRLWINNETVLDAWAEHDKVYFSNTIYLKAGNTYNLRIDFFNATREGMIQLKWQLPSQKPKFGGYFGTNEQIIDPKYFGNPTLSPVEKPIVPKEVKTEKPKPAPKKEVKKSEPKTVTVPTMTLEKPSKDTVAKYIPKNILFEKSTNIMVGTSMIELDNLAKMLQRFPSATLRIEGHTDNIGDAALNQKLSDERAEAVKTYLTQKGVAANRLTAKGFGSSRPLFKDSGGNPKNRRVEFFVE
jgi:peptidoglycan-binding protein ArfA